MALAKHATWSRVLYLGVMLQVLGFIVHQNHYFNGFYWYLQVLEELAAAHPVARLLQERRTLAKVLADFVNTFAHRARRASFGSPGVVRNPCSPSSPFPLLQHVGASNGGTGTGVGYDGAPGKWYRAVAAYTAEYSASREVVVQCIMLHNMQIGLRSEVHRDCLHGHKDSFVHPACSMHAKHSCQASQ